MNLAANLVSASRRWGPKPAVRLDEQVLSYRALDVASARFAGLLREHGVEAGDRVAMMVPNVLEFPVIYYGILRAGGVVVPVDVMLRRRELQYHLADSGARLLFAWHALAEEAEAGADLARTECLFVTPGEFGRLLTGVAPLHEPVDREPSATAAILYASGATGRPKGAELTHASLASSVETVVALHGFDEATVTLGALPLFHSFGQTCSLDATVAAGGCLTLLPRFDARKALEIIERDGVTIFQGAPAMYSALLDDPERSAFDVSTLRECVSGDGLSGLPVAAEAGGGSDA